MATNANSKFTDLSCEPCKAPSMVLQIEGHEYVYASTNIGFSDKFSVRPWVTLDGTIRDLNQQLNIQSGGGSSITRARVRLVDLGQQLTNDFSFNVSGFEILSSNATVWWGFAGGEFPRDYFRIIQGVVDSTSFGPGYLTLNISHSDKLRRSDIFLNVSSELTADLAAPDTVIEIEDASDFLSPAQGLRTLVRVNDEVIEYSAVTGDSLPIIQRGFDDTILEPHEAEDEASTIYELSGTAIDLALRIYLSTGEDLEIDSKFVESLVDGPEAQVQNAVFFCYPDIEDLTGVTPGDFITLSGTSNDFTNRLVVDTGCQGEFSFIVVDGPALSPEQIQGATVTIRSKYNTLPSGCGMRIDQVDVARHEALSETFSSQEIDYRFYLKETIRADSFVNEQILRPSGFYFLPRQGRVSIGVLAPPLARADSLTIDERNVISPDGIEIERSINRDFFNSVIYNFDEDILEDRLIASRILFSADSVARINAPNTSLTIDSRGSRSNSDTRAIIDSNSERWLERYRFGAERITVDIILKDALSVEIGDTVIFGSGCLQVSDINNGTRNFQPRIMEVINRRINWTRSSARLVLLDTAFQINGRFGVVSPSSRVLGGTESCLITAPFCESITDLESETWAPFVGTRILVRNEDFSISQEVTLVGVTPNGELKISPSLDPSYDLSTLIIDPADYPDNADPTDQAIWKNIYTYFNPQVKVASSSNLRSVFIDPSEVPLFSVGSIVLIHDSDFTNQTQELTVSSVLSNEIMFSQDMNYQPSTGDCIELIGFSDGGLPYRLL